MKEREDFETVEIPDILLELNGMRTASRIVSAEKLIEAETILASGRFVEAGIGDFLKNLIKGRRFNPEEVEAIIAKLKGFVSNGNLVGSAEQQLATQKQIEFLESLNKNTGGKFIRKK